MLAVVMSLMAPLTWLDQPLANWNTAGAEMPQAPAGGESIAAIVSRCKLQPPHATAAEKAVASAGWIPFWNVDQQLIREDVEIVGGMRSADEACQPAAFNLFVFVGHRFAGTLSPIAMGARTDGSAGAVRLAPPLVSAEFSRFKAGDPPCCPTSKVTVRYRIDRTPQGSLVVPTDIRTTRPGAGELDRLKIGAMNPYSRIN